MQAELITLQKKDLKIVKEIYDYYILNSTYTFHIDQISIKELKKFIFINHPKYKSYLIYLGNKPCGYCYIVPYSKRPSYNRTAEITIYLKPDYTQQGIGKQVLDKLIHIAQEVGIKVLMAGITATNQHSIRLFEKYGFEKCAHFKQVGEKFNQLIDVFIYQIIL